MSEPKRHHYVPKAYLARFGVDEQVRVCRRDGRSYTTSVLNVAVGTGFYTIGVPGGGKSNDVEKFLAEWDGEAVNVMHFIDEHLMPPPPSSLERNALAAYLALQTTRTAEHRERTLFPMAVADYASDREIDEDLIAEYLERVHLGFKPREQEISAALTYVQVALREPATLTKEFAISTMLSSVEHIVPILLQMRWTLEIARKPQLITSDCPLVIWRRPSIEDHYKGFGIMDADEIRFPLDPGKQLVLRHDGPDVRAIEPARVWACNQDIADGCHKAIVGHPVRSAWTQRLILSARAARLRFNTGPGYNQEPDGSLTPFGEVLHIRVERSAMLQRSQRGTRAGRRSRART